MFKRPAKFWLLQSRGIAPGPREAVSANDNLPHVLRPIGQRWIRSQPLAHWSLIDSGARLGCRWHAKPLAPTVLEDPDSERMNNPVASDLACPSPQLTKFGLTVGT